MWKACDGTSSMNKSDLNLPPPPTTQDEVIIVLFQGGSFYHQVLMGPEKQLLFQPRT